MKTQLRLRIRVAAAALALSACGIAVDASAGTSVAHASVVSARHAPADTRFADLKELARVKRDVTLAAVQRARAQTDASRFANLKDLAQVKRDVVWTAGERASAHARARGVFGGDRSALSSDSGRAGCASLSGTHQVAVGDYPKIAAQFAGSRWPDLRMSGLAYVEIATKQLSMRAYGGETVWFYQRLSAACWPCTQLAS